MIKIVYSVAILNINMNWILFAILNVRVISLSEMRINAFLLLKLLTAFILKEKYYQIIIENAIEEDALQTITIIKIQKNVLQAAIVVVILINFIGKEILYAMHLV